MGRYKGIGLNYAVDANVDPILFRHCGRQLEGREDSNGLADAPSIWEKALSTHSEHGRKDRALVCWNGEVERTLQLSVLHPFARKAMPLDIPTQMPLMSKRAATPKKHLSPPLVRDMYQHKIKYKQWYLKLKVSFPRKKIPPPTFNNPLPSTTTQIIIAAFGIILLPLINPSHPCLRSIPQIHLPSLSSHFTYTPHHHHHPHPPTPTHHNHSKRS